MTVTTATPTVLVVLVAHDGAQWLPRTLGSLDAQTYPALDVIAVDNASGDGSRQLLLDHLGPEQVLLSDRDVGFGAAVDMALNARSEPKAPYVLTLHDDCALAPDAIAELVAAMEMDPRLAVTGAKLRDWGADSVLQAVGWTIDATGRSDTGVDSGELDQGQRDQDRRSLYVSTTAMLVRREVYEEVGGFDHRYHVFRDDLDLCWRVWMIDRDVEVVPSAIAEHVGGASNYLRLGQTQFLGPRYFSERNTLATLLKNYGLARLFVVLPLYFLVGFAKMFGFVLTRRFSDTWQTVRAWLWNLLHLPETLRYRRRVQRARTRNDKELKELFGRIGPRVRAYVEAMASWIAGGDRDPAPEPSNQPDPAPEHVNVFRRTGRFVRRRPVLVVGGLLAVLMAASLWTLLVPGQLRGGEMAPWPASPMAFLSDYIAPVHDAGAFVTSDAPSPARALLGMLQLLLGGSAYLASRAALILPLIAAWVFALRAAQAYSKRRLPRVVAATAYVLSPPALAALTEGRIGALVALAVLPGLVASGVTLARRRTAPARAWRAVAGASLLGAIGGAFEPALLVAIIVSGLAITIVGLIRARSVAWRAALAARAGLAVLGPLVLLMPWSLDLFAENGLLAGSSERVVGGELWQWLLLAPDLSGFAGIVAGVGFVIAGLLGLLLGVRRNPGLVTAMWAMALIGAVGGWLLDRSLSAVWAGLPLMVTAAAFAGLFALAFATGESQLARHAFGWRQLTAIAGVFGVLASMGAVANALLQTSWDNFTIDDGALPSFIVAEASNEGPFRTVMLAEHDEQVYWEVVDGGGPTMTSYGVEAPTVATELVGDAVEGMLFGQDPRSMSRLGTLNVRYVVVPDEGSSAALGEALRAQTGLEPRPVASGQLLEIPDWLPRAVAVTAGDIPSVETPLSAQVELTPLEQIDYASYEGEVEGESSVLLAEVADEGWRLEAGGRRYLPSDDTFVRFDEVAAGSMDVWNADTTRRGLEVTGQLLAVLLAISLALRPPSFARSHARSREGDSGEEAAGKQIDAAQLPKDAKQTGAGPGDTDDTGHDPQVRP